MRCTSPRTVGFQSDGKTLCWSPKKYSKQYAPFQIPCGKCISCRLENARQTAVRCVHEASMYEKNSFVTLTYSQENLKSDRLQYVDFQKFVKDIRNHEFQKLLNELFPDYCQKDQRILWKNLNKEERKIKYEKIQTAIFCAGEYGEKGKRPHWHAIIFNWRPDDLSHKYNNHRGDQVYNSKTLEQLWPHGISELGSVTFESAGYVARYATKKLVHGRDGTHDYTPISRRSTRNAIGKKWIEKYYQDVFNVGFLVMPDGSKSGIPRYYEKWFKQHHPDKWVQYIVNIKQKVIDDAQKKEEKITREEKKANLKRSGLKGLQISRNRQREKILKQKFDQLQNNLKI